MSASPSSPIHSEEIKTLLHLNLAARIYYLLACVCSRLLVAEKAGVPRESIYRALSPSGNPRITTLLGILKATGLKLTVQAA